MRPSVLNVMVLIAGLASSAGLASAQCNIPTSVIESRVVDAAGEQAISSCVTYAKGAFAKDDEGAIMARKQLMQALVGQRPPSADFRLKFDRAAKSMLEPIIKGDREIASINALIIAGEIATSGSVDLLKQGLADSRVSVRMAAASGYERTFQILAGDMPEALLANQASDALNHVIARIPNEQDPIVLLQLFTAIDAAASIPPVGDFRDLPGKAVVAAATGAGERAAKGGVVMELPMLRASQTVLTALTKTKDAPVLDANARRSIAQFAGDQLALVLRRVNAGNFAQLEKNDREALADLAKRSENILSLINIEGYRPGPVKGIGDLLRSGDERGFTAGAMLVIGTDGTLTKAPFNFPADRFKVN